MNIMGINYAVLNAPTIHRMPLEPSAVNFFYGKNGTGKSSIAKALANRDTIKRWSDDLPYGAEVYLYNEETIERTVTSCQAMPGVCTLSEGNVALQAQLEEKTAEASRLAEQIRAMKDRYTSFAQIVGQERENTTQTIWRMTASLRTRYPEVIGEFGTDIFTFADHLLECHRDNHDQENMDICYNMAFPETNVVYDPFQMIPESFYPTCDLLDIPVANHEYTTLALFYQKLGNMEWVRRGFEAFHQAADCKCPFCGQTLPVDFAATFEKCLDKTYLASMLKLQSFRDKYSKSVEKTGQILCDNLQHPLVAGTEYEALGELLLERLQGNLTLIDRKIQSPLCECRLREISSVLERMQTIAETINRKISHRIQTVQNLPAARKRICKMVWETMAYECREQLDYYSKKENEKKLRGMELELETMEGKHACLLREIQDMKAVMTDITKTMDEINHTLSSNGFTSFHFRKKDAQHYEVIREDGSLAEHLSEGERKFISFLYFVHTVTSTEEGHAEQHGKVIVIDDPVCSLDSEAMSFVAGMIRWLIDQCLSRYRMQQQEEPDSGILQVFCMTHNPFFFREISDVYLGDYNHCAYFEVRKGRDNSTSIERCIQRTEQVGREPLNRSPVEDVYRMRWREYVRAKDPQDLLRITRDILCEYFLLTCHMDEREMRRMLLDEYRTHFAQSDGDDWQTNYNIVCSMVSLMSMDPCRNLGSMYFDVAAVDCGQIRFVFGKIFEIMHQEQHFNHMIRTVEYSLLA